MTYTELVAAIQSYTENYEQEFASYIPTFIRQTETRVYNTVQIPALRRNQTGTLTAGNKYLSAPGDFLSVYSMAVIQSYGTANETYTYLLDKDVNYIREAYPTPADTGLPAYYAIFGPTVSDNVTSDELTFIVGPTPNTSYTVELHYYYYPESITTAADGRTWLGDNFDPVLLYGSLREAYLYMKGEQDLIANVEAKYAEAMGQLKRLGDGLERQDAYRSGQTRVRVT
jgi:hypothetical protein